MGYVSIETRKATVTKLHPFWTAQGQGLDIYLEAKSNDCTVYLQVVVYDEQADIAMQILHVEDSVNVAGVLRFKKYTMEDGQPGYSMFINKPTLFDKCVCGGRIEQIVPFRAPYQPEQHAATAAAVPSHAETADQDDESELPF